MNSSLRFLLLFSCSASFAMATTPTFGVVEPDDPRAQLVVRENEFGTGNVLSESSTTLDPAPLGGSLSDSISTSGTTPLGQTYSEQLDASIAWWFSPDGTQGWLRQAITKTRELSDPLLTAGTYTTYGYDVRRGYTLLDAATYYEDLWIEGLSAPISSETSYSAGYTGELGGGGSGAGGLTSIVLFALGDAAAGTPENPWKPRDSDKPTDPTELDNKIDNNFDEEGDEPPERPSNVAGINLTSTFSTPSTSNGAGVVSPHYYDPELAIGYGYFTQDGSRFTSFEIPTALPQGDVLFAIHHAGESYPLSAGQSFDFTALDPTGVESFLLLGIDEAELLDVGDTHPSFVFGLTFAEAGVNTFSTFPLVAVPEPGALVLAVLAVCGVVACPLRSLQSPRFR